MNILFLCNKNPYPEKDGGSIAMNANIKEAVKRNYYVKVLAVNSDKIFTDVNTIPDNYKDATHYESVYFNLKVRPFPFFKTFFTKKSPHIIRFISEDYKKRLSEILTNTDFDIVMLESLFMCPYIEIIRQHSRAEIVLRSHNIEHQIWKRIYKNCNNIIKKPLLKHVYKTLERYELSVLYKVDAIAAITDIDASFFRENTTTPVFTLPFGIDIEHIRKPENASMEKNSLFHLGSMNWEPNIEGVNWFLENIAPALNKDLPDVKIYLAGRNMPQTLYDKHPENVVVVGEVEDAYSFMCSKQIMFIPLLSGSGMRIKLIEAMTLCKSVISTSIGAEGVEVENGKDIVIADTPDEMIFRIKQLFNNPEAANFIGQNAGEKAKKYNIKQIFDSFENFINTNLTNSNG